eukprot:2624341-Rhodomonas_salina.2
MSGLLQHRQRLREGEDGDHHDDGRGEDHMMERMERIGRPRRPRREARRGMQGGRERGGKRGKRGEGAWLQAGASGRGSDFKLNLKEDEK